MSINNPPSRMMASCRAGIDLFHDLPAAQEEDVIVVRLRCAAPRHRCLGQVIPIDDGDAVEEAKEHAGGEQSRDAAADHDRVAAAHE
jgi:hypothetical protein